MSDERVRRDGDGPATEEDEAFEEFIDDAAVQSYDIDEVLDPMRPHDDEHSWAATSEELGAANGAMP